MMTPEPSPMTSRSGRPSGRPKKRRMNGSLRNGLFCPARRRVATEMLTTAGAAFSITGAMVMTPRFSSRMTPFAPALDTRAATLRTAAAAVREIRPSQAIVERITSPPSVHARIVDADGQTTRAGSKRARPLRRGSPQGAGHGMDRVQPVLHDIVHVDDPAHHAVSRDGHVRDVVLVHQLQDRRQRLADLAG